MSQLDEKDEKESILEIGNVGIIPNTRIESLKCFYASSILSLGDLVDEVVPSGLSEDARGSWATKKVMEAAVAFNVQQFIECDEKGGEQLPIIEELEEYVLAHKKIKEGSMNDRIQMIKELQKQKKISVSRIDVMEEELGRLMDSEPSTEVETTSARASFSATHQTRDGGNNFHRQSTSRTEQGVKIILITMNKKKKK